MWNFVDVNLDFSIKYSCIVYNAMINIYLQRPNFGFLIKKEIIWGIRSCINVE